MMKIKNFQSIRIRTVKFVAVLFVGLIVAIYVLVGTMMGNSIREAEEKNIAEHVQLVQNTISYELKSLSKMALDWGLWDDTYQFMQDGNEGYLAANMTVESLSNIGVDFVIYIDPEGHSVYHGEIDAAGEQIRPLAAGFMEAFAESPVLKNRDNTYRVQGVISLNGRTALIASAPILPSNGAALVLGNVIMGTYLDADAVQLLSERLNMSIRMDRWADLPPEDAAVFQAISPQNPLIVRDVSETKIAGYSVLADIDEKPLLGMRVESERELTRIGYKGIYYLMVSLIVASFMVIAGILLFVEKNILSRLLSLNKTINEITEHHDFSLRVPKQVKNDELSFVVDDINAMLDGLEKAEQQITEMNRNLEEKVEERTSKLSAANHKLEGEILQREKIEAQIKYIADHDNLTDLPNRRSLLVQINHAVALAKRIDRMMAVMFIDLDNFKLINDTLGHSAGDKLLVAVSGKLVENLRESDFIARIGGDEFVVLIENLEDVDAVNNVAQKILRIFKDPIPINKQECFVSASIGVALYPEDGTDAEALLKNADIAMYRAKSNGKNQCVYCTPLMKTSVVKTMKLTNSLHYALERGELEVYYQPQLCCHSLKLSGMEALLRWNHPELGLVLPGVFIPIAEQNGLIMAIGSWVLRTACRQNKAWQDAGFPKVCVAVNLSIRQFLDARLLKEVEAILEETGLEPKYLELEITESIAMKENKYIVEVLDAFKAMGIRISIDDFGTDYASFTHLKYLPVDKIKIDMTFIHGIGIHKKDEAIIKAIILLAKNMGFSVIAEGVETEEQLAFLLEEKCSDIQGNYCHKPMPAGDVEKIFNRK